MHEHLIASFSLREKVPVELAPECFSRGADEGKNDRMRRTFHESELSFPHPSLRATFSQREKGTAKPANPASSSTPP